MATVLNLFPSQIQFVNSDGTLTSEAYRALQTLMVRVGGPISPSITEVNFDVSSVQASIGVIDKDIAAIQAEMGATPLPTLPGFDDPLTPAPIDPQAVESLQSEVAALREAIARLTSQIQDINQGKL